MPLKLQIFTESGNPLVCRETTQQIRGFFMLEYPISCRFYLKNEIITILRTEKMNTC